MHNASVNKNMRRRFLLSAPGLLLVPRLLAAEIRQSEGKKKPVLLDALTEQEKEHVDQSAMAGELTDYFGEGYSCAESILMVSLRHMGLPEDYVWAAAGFGGGLYHKNLCGFLTGGIMALGFQGGLQKGDRAEIKTACSEKVKAYWKWWQTVAPLQCGEIRPPGSSSGRCSRLGHLAAAEIETLLAV
jgi:hypothetical protein